MGKVGNIVYPTRKNMEPGEQKGDQTNLTNEVLNWPSKMLKSNLKRQTPHHFTFKE